MSLETWLVMTTTSLIAVLLPGPSCLLSLNNGIIHGKRKSIATALGISIAAMSMAFVSVLGLGVILETSGLFFAVVKYAGAAYLVYLGIKVWKAPVEEYKKEKEEYDKKRSSFVKLFLQALLVGLSNPKAIIFYAAFLPQFIDPTSNSINQYMIIMFTIFLVVFISMMVYVIGGGIISPYIKKIKFKKMLNRVTGGTFLGFGTAIIVSDN